MYSQTILPGGNFFLQQLSDCPYQENILVMCFRLITKKNVNEIIEYVYAWLVQEEVILWLEETSLLGNLSKHKY